MPRTTPFERAATTDTHVEFVKRKFRAEAAVPLVTIGQSPEPPFAVVICTNSDVTKAHLVGLLRQLIETFEADPVPGASG